MAGTNPTTRGYFDDGMGLHSPDVTPRQNPTSLRTLAFSCFFSILIFYSHRMFFSSLLEWSRKIRTVGTLLGGPAAGRPPSGLSLRPPPSAGLPAPEALAPAQSTTTVDGGSTQKGGVAVGVGHTTYPPHPLRRVACASAEVVGYNHHPAIIKSWVQNQISEMNGEK